MEKTSTRWSDWPSVIFLFFIIQVSTWRLQATDWTEGLHLIRNLAMLGLLLGMTLGVSIFQKRNVILLSVTYMLIFFIWQWLGFIKFDDEQNYLGQKFLILFGRLFTTISEFLSGREVGDQLLVMALLCIPYWFVSLYSGYQLTRYANVLKSILPSASLMFIVHYYHYTTKDYSWIFGVFLFFTLLLIGRQKYLADKAKWAKERVFYSNESSLDINNTTFSVAATIVLLAWMIPYTLPTNVEARGVWQNTFNEWLSGEQLENLFSSVNKEKKPQAKNFQTELGLGTQTSQSDAVIFLVYTPPKAQEYPRLYWRGQVYDTYQDGKWLISSGNEIRYSSSRDIEIPDTQNRSRLTFTFDIYTETQIVLFSAAQPIWVNHNAILLHEKISPSETEPELDLLTIRAAPALEIGDLVRIASMMSNPIVSELRSASEEYPSWVTEKYLQLPDNFSQEIRILSFDISQPYNNSYDKTLAITNYLRRQIEYAPAISIPEDTDPLEYFLFDAKRGFCNYSATVEVLMLRSIGIPARLAVGYAQGEANLQNSIYTVRERDLHAWPEVYFPEYGWIEFEPTGNQDPLNRPVERVEQTAALPIPLNPVRQLPAEEQDQAQVKEEANAEDATNAILTRIQIRWIGLLSGVILLLGVALIMKRRYARDTAWALMLKIALEKSKWKTPTWLNNFVAWVMLLPIEKSFDVINTGLRWLKKPQAIHSTPIERAAVLKKLLPNAESSIEILLREYQSEMFSRTRGDEKLARHAAFWILFCSIRARVKIFIMGYN